jgi:hypothetical protein
MLLVAAGCGVCLSVAAAAWQSGGAQRNDATTTGSAVQGVSANMHFTDEQGRPRLPTEAERAALAEAFQADLLELTRGKRIPKGSQSMQTGVERAVVGASHLRFLTVTVDENGSPSYGHSSIDEDGRIAVNQDDSLPEM